MHWIRRKTVETILPALLLSMAFCMVCFGAKPLWSSRESDLWPQLPLVSVPQGTTPDVWSSVSNLLDVGIASLQVVLVVEFARVLWVVSGTMTTGRFALTLLYQLALFFDMLRLWARDWFVWARHALRIGDLCDPTEPCYPVSGAVPWLSLVALILLVFLLFKSPTLHRNPDLGRDRA